MTQKNIPSWLALLGLATLLLVSSCKKQEFDTHTGSTMTRENNKPPVARAGNDTTILLPEGWDFHLNSSQSYDPEKYDLRLQWKQLEGPAPLFALSSSGEVRIIREGKYSFELTAADYYDVTDKDTIVIIAKWKDGVTRDRQPMNFALSALSTSPETGSSYPAFTFAGSRLIIAGGSVSDLPPRATSLVQYYDIPGGTWGKFNLSDSKMDMTVAASGSKAFFAGGYNVNNAYGDVEIYDFDTQKLSSAPLSMPRAGIRSIVAGNKIFFAGGEKWFPGQTQFFDNVDIYDEESQTWSVANLSEPREGLATVSLGGKVYFAGGIGKNGVTDRIDIYDLASGQWTVSRMSQGLVGVTAGTLYGRIYFAGAYPSPAANPQLQSSSIEIFDPTNLSTRQDGIFPFTKPLDFQGGPIITLRDQAIHFLQGNGVNTYDQVKNQWSVGMVPGDEPLYYFSMGDQLYSVELLLTDDHNGGIGKYIINKVDIRP